MNIRRVFTTALAVGAGLIGILTVSHGIHAAYAQDGESGPRGHHRRGGGIARLCNGGMSQNLDRITDHLKSELDLTTAQEQNWTNVTQALQTSDLQSACSSMDGDAAAPRTALDKLDRMETMFETGLSTVQQVRPSFETFYTSLSSDQQAQLDTLMSRRQRRR